MALSGLESTLTGFIWWWYKADALQQQIAGGDRRQGGLRQDGHADRQHAAAGCLFHRGHLQQGTMHLTLSTLHACLACHARAVISTGMNCGNHVLTGVD
jgi:hypothetical protein